jgi:hypothetical protein
MPPTQTPADARALSLKANAKLRDAQRRLTDLRYQRQAGELISIADAEEAWGDVIAGLQILVRSYAGRARAALPHLSGSDRETLQAIGQDILRELAAKAKPPPLPAPSKRNGRARKLDTADD